MATDVSCAQRRAEAARLLDKYPNARTQGQLHSLDDMVAKDLARAYPMATGRELQRAMTEGSPHIHERKPWHIDDDTRRTVRKAWGGNRSPGCARRGAAAAARIRHSGWTECGDDAGGPAVGATVVSGFGLMHGN